MILQTVYDKVTFNDPLGADKLAKAIYEVVDSQLIPGLVAQIEKAAVLGSPNDSDDVILTRVREVRWQIAVLKQLQEELSNLKMKELSDE